ncbi:MAG: hypothetical protein IJQ82_00600 [Selenomonadaceae bacterium]|nr:hypothetical protein [Selenomonadaceae bacterium]
MAKNRLADMTMDYSDVAAEMFEDGVELDNEVSLRIMANMTRHKMRRIQSEMALEEKLPWYWEQGVSYHCISSGDVDGLTYFRACVKQQRIKYALLATWSMAAEDIREIRHWVNNGYIKRIDCYVGEMFLSAGRSLERRELINLCRGCGGRLVIFRTHAKVIAGFGEQFDFAIAGSANINTNPRVEEMIITVDSDLAKFYKEYFDEVQSFERNFDEVKPWQPES